MLPVSDPLHVRATCSVCVFICDRHSGEIVPEPILLAKGFQIKIQSCTCNASRLLPVYSGVHACLRVPAFSRDVVLSVARRCAANLFSDSSSRLYCTAPRTTKRLERRSFDERAVRRASSGIAVALGRCVRGVVDESVRSRWPAAERVDRVDCVERAETLLDLRIASRDRVPCRALPASLASSRTTGPNFQCANVRIHLNVRFAQSYCAWLSCRRPRS